MSVRGTTKSPSGTKFILFLVASALLVWAVVSGALPALAQAFAAWFADLVIG